MSSSNPEWTDQRVERIVGEILRAGVLLAAAIVAVGEVWSYPINLRPRQVDSIEV